MFVVALFISICNSADIAFIVTSKTGDHYFKMVSSPERVGVGSCFKVSAKNQDLQLWRTSGWFSNVLFLSQDCQYLIRGERDRIFIYQQGELLLEKTFAELSQPNRLYVDIKNSQFEANQWFKLVFTNGAQARLPLLASTEKQTDSTQSASIKKPTRQHLETVLPVNSKKVSKTASKTVAITTHTTAQTATPKTAAKSSHRTTPTPASPTSAPSTMTSIINPAEESPQPQSGQQLPEEIWRCEVTALLKGTAKSRTIAQQGPAQEVALDRAMAYCEGVLGVGSKNPLGFCKLSDCFQKQP
ncbi:MAG: hypothetical protein KUG79_12090 [Pseudomonadales bacterium]|nr:hypothetical protein [Pseudomonadales bacterium]